MKEKRQINVTTLKGGDEMKKMNKKKVLLICTLALVIATGLAVGGKIVPLIDPPYPLVRLFEGLLK